MTDDLDFDDILDKGFTNLFGYDVTPENVERMASLLAGDVMNAFSEEFRQLVKQGLIDRFNASIDVENDNWKFVYRDRLGYGPK